MNDYAFLTATLKGFWFVKVEDVSYFEYKKTDRCWSLFLTDGSTFKMKRETTSEIILEKSLFYIRINQHQIINVKYLHSIEGRMCCLSTLNQNRIGLLLSRDCLKDLKTRFEII